MKSINVLIITYNQQLVIGRAIESILVQKSFGLNKIIISDDHSTDNNWDVINQYYKQYPDIIEIHQNVSNLGVYGNAEKIIGLRGDADLYHFMAGDDALCEEWFKTVQEFIDKNDIDFEGVPAVLYSDWKRVTPEGIEKLVSQKVIADQALNPMSLRLRGLISVRSTLWTKELISCHKAVDLEHGVSRAETMFDNQIISLSERFYYIPYVATIYFSGLGVSTKIYTKEYQKEILYNKEQCLNDYNWDKKDRCYLLYSIYRTKLAIKPKLNDYLKMVIYYFRSRKKGYPTKGPSSIKLLAIIFKQSFLTTQK